MGFVYIAVTIILTVYGQLVLKWRVDLRGELPETVGDKIIFLFSLLLDPWVISGFLMAFIAGLAWMAALTKLDLSYAYPFMSASFILVLILSGALFSEAITTPKVIGILLITTGIIVSSQG